MFNPTYIQQAKLLVRCLPVVGQQAAFALKGGTAINLFVRPMPRLSVDIDLTYLPLHGRAEALAGITTGLEAVARAVPRHIPGALVQFGRARGQVTKLVIAHADVQIKVEPNHVLRGSVYPPEVRDLSAAAQELLEQFVSVPTLSQADLYGGKICAALDRQHPRDLFDVHLLLENEGLTPAIRRAFVVYLASHDRPMSELLDPQFKDIAEAYATQFAGMPREPVPLEILIETRARLVALIRRDLDADEIRFLLSLKQGDPDWSALDLAHLKELPALQWKLQNIRRMAQPKRAQAFAKLQRLLER